MRPRCREKPTCESGRHLAASRQIESSTPMSTSIIRFEKFYELLRSGFHRAGETGVCQFHVTGASPPSFHVEVTEDAIRYDLGEHDAPTTTITIPETLFALMVARPAMWDLRHPEVIAKVSVTGDLNLAVLLGNLAKTPTKVGIDLFGEAERNARANGLMSCDVARVSAPTQREVVEYLERGIPLVVTDSLRSVGAWTWDLQQIKDAFADLKVEFSDEETGAPTTLGRFLDSVDAGREAYAHGILLPAPMRPYFRIPFFAGDVFNPPMLWMGKKHGATGEEPCTSLHRDTMHGFLGQVRGTKRIVLCSPDQAEKVYPVPAYNVYQPCRIRVAKPDYERFPLSRGLRAIEVALHPGELLVIPVGWFHEIYCTEPVLSVSLFMDWNAWKTLSNPTENSARTSHA